MIEHNPDLGLGILFLSAFIIAMILIIATTVFDYKFKKTINDIKKNRINNFKDNIK